MRKGISNRARIIDYVDVRAMRKASGKTLKELAGDSGNMAIEDWAKIERGYSGSTLHTLQRVADAFKCRIEIKFVPVEP